VRAKFRHRTTRRLGVDRPQTKYANSQIFRRFILLLKVNENVIIIYFSFKIKNPAHLNGSINFSSQNTGYRHKMLEFTEGNWHQICTKNDKGFVEDVT